MQRDVIILAGLWNSGPQHWQTLWQARHPEWTRAPHRDWNHPECGEWVAELDAVIAASEGPPILVAHSLGCVTVAKWAGSGSALKVAGAFLVAPSDVDAQTCPKEAAGFQPMPMEKLPFPSVMVASADDDYITLERARALAAAWGSRLVEIGNAGHVNDASGYGAWPEGQRMLDEFCRQLG